jgi:hypothetical protein
VPPLVDVHFDLDVAGFPHPRRGSGTTIAATLSGSSPRRGVADVGCSTRFFAPRRRPLRSLADDLDRPIDERRREAGLLRARRELDAPLPPVPNLRRRTEGGTPPSPRGSRIPERSRSLRTSGACASAPFLRVTRDLPAALGHGRTACA